MSQLSLPMGWGGPSDDKPLLLCPENAQALALLRDWRRWPGPCALLTGDRYSGRSSLARLFLAESEGMFIDDADAADEECLFHAWNAAQASGTPLLFVSVSPPPQWAIGLPDLRTRLATAAVATILPPGEALIGALLTLGLDRAGTAYAPDLPDFVARRLERCYLAVHRAIDILNAASLSKSRKISVATGKLVLGEAGLIAPDP